MTFGTNKRWPYKTSGLLKEISYDRTRKRWPLNRGDCMGRFDFTSKRWELWNQTSLEYNTPLNTTLPCVLYKQSLLSLFIISHDGYITFYTGKWTHENGGDFGKLQIRNISFFLLFCLFTFIKSEWAKNFW